MKTKTGVGLVVLAACLAWWLAARDSAEPPTTATNAAVPPRPVRSAPTPRPAPRIPPVVPAANGDDDTLDGRVLDAVTRAGVADAELTFVGDRGVTTFRTGSDGTFLLAPPDGARLALATITARGYLPYVAGVSRGPRVSIAPGPGVHGVTLLLSPAVDYHGQVIDAHGTGIAGARVRVIERPGDDVLDGRGPAVSAAEWRSGSIDDVETAGWTTGPDGRFTFQAAADAILLASHGAARGSARLDDGAVRAKAVTILLDGLPPRDAAITGRVRDTHGAPIAGARIQATPSTMMGGAASAYATSADDGTFALANVDHAAYDLTAEAADHIAVSRVNILGGTRNLELVLDDGVMLAGQVVDRQGAPVPIFMLQVRRRAGSARTLVATRSIVDPQGRFAVRVLHGDYDVSASPRGCGSGASTQATAGARDVRVVLGSSATLRGRVIAGDDRAPIGNAIVACETASRGRDVISDAGTTTRPDGSFELTGIPAGPVALAVRADGYHTKIDTSTTARDGADLGPVTIELARVGADEWAATEVVGIGVMLSPDGDAIRVDKVLLGGSAFDAGLDFGERIVAIDGLPVGPLGIDAAYMRIRGVAGTTVTLTVQRPGGDVQLVIERRAFRGPSPPRFVGARSG